MEVKCPENFLLVSFKFEQNVGKDVIKTVFKCQEPNVGLKPITKLLTDEEKLDADSVDCSNVNGILSTFKFSNDQNNQVKSCSCS